MIDSGTELLGRYVQEKGICLTSISKNTGISYGKIFRSFSERTRSLRADEFLSICSFLALDPMNFYLKPNRTNLTRQKAG